MSTVRSDDLSRERKLRELAERKKKLQLERDELDYKIIQIQAEYGALYNNTAPILNLPIEIMCRMFELAHHASFTEGIPENPLIEVTISHVCREWRSVALSFQSLWSNFRYNVDELPKRIPIDRLVAYLERSGSCLLDLHFAFSEYALGEGSQSLFNSMLENTISHVDRWRRFSLFADVDAPMLDFSDRLRQLKAANLEYFTMCPSSSEPGTPGFDGMAPSVFLGGAPKLFYVRLDGTSFRNYSPPFSNVTVLRLEDEIFQPDVWNFWSFALFLEILALPSLSGLSIVGEHFMEPDLPHSSQITMNNLKHLRYGGDHSLVGHFLPFLVAPLLETLIIKGTTLPPIPSPVPKFMRPFSNLHSLELIECTYYDAGFINSLVTLTPHVTHLTIVDDSGGENMLQCVSRPFLENGTRSWPKVKFLTSSRLDDHPILPYIDFARMIGNPKLTICTDTGEWAFDDPGSYQSLNAICVLHDELPDKPKIVSWPPGVDVPAEQDFFTIEY
ncbi:hypothetical protein K443DRAFT_685430 [Laccaria amethystina LaAM-08-1]|uniref:F-box domain-containing protein n=1 Tax=Laccaria amethystina LaAM-08-1 TaxID=1095629 RepID=A0A0C9WNQ3_9AGAR|nr:hypothetical protein K443DRAFT_685430 [Laccaria amethystina LaAM-08-1]